MRTRALAAGTLLAALAVGGCGSSGSTGNNGSSGAVSIGANDDVAFGAKAADVAAAFKCTDPKPYSGALSSAFADAVTCTGTSKIVMLVATFTGSSQYSKAVTEVFEHAGQRSQGAAIAEGGTFLVTADVDAAQPSGVTFSAESAAVKDVSDKLGVSFGASGPPATPQPGPS